MLYLLSDYSLFKQFCGKGKSKCLDREFKNLCMSFFLTLHFKSGDKYYRKKMLKMEMSDLSDKRNLDKSKVLSVQSEWIVQTTSK